MEKSYHSFFATLKGKTVTIYKGGPESKKGKLLAVNPDFITLLVENTNNVIYYQVQHVKSVTEDTKTNSIQMADELDVVEYHHAESFTSLLEKFKGEIVLINQGGPDSRKGRLVAVFNDFIVLFTEDDGLVYINLYHVKSISLVVQDGEKKNQDSIVQIPEWVCVDHFQDIFKHFTQHWITVKSGGPENLEGVLVENTGGHYTLVNNQDVIRIQPFHIQSISIGPKGQFKQQNQNKKQEQSEESSNENQNEESSESSSTESSSQHSTSSSRRSSRKSNRRSGSSRERIVKTIDYRWKF
ncbi:MAG: spore coat protein [Bacillota bacterium]|nr:spore coat protein [Bacillota bacterium]